MFAREPVFPNEAVEVMENTSVDWDAAYADTVPSEVLTRSLLERAALLRRYAPLALGNILIAQHRQSLYYARRRDGTWAIAVPDWFQPGQFVTTQKVKTTNLDPPAFNCLRVLYVRPDGTLVLQGLDGSWFTDHGAHWAPLHDAALESTYVDRELARSRNLTPKSDIHFGCPICNSMDSEADVGWVKDPTRSYDSIICDWCETMHHCVCVGLSVAQRDRLDTWYCPTCVRFAAPPHIVGRNAAFP